MGERKGRYNSEFPDGSLVKIADDAFLKDFMRSWKLHNPLQPDQIPFAGRIATVAKVGFYHGGYELYQLVDVPGIWHEQCLSAEEPS